jgi:hypothetical protein
VAFGNPGMASPHHKEADKLKIVQAIDFIGQKAHLFAVQKAVEFALRLYINST